MARMREHIARDNGSGSPKDRRARKRISIYLNDDGAPDWDALPDEHREKLGYGATPRPAPEPPAEIPPEMVGFLLQTMTRIESVVVAGRMGVTSDEAMSALTPPPPLAQGLNEAGARVLNKYSGTLGRWQDEIVLASLLVTWQASAFAELRALSASKRPQPETPPAPIEVHKSATVQTSSAPPVILTHEERAASAMYQPDSSEPFAGVETL